jgi:pimeloyl-ACP methyl ester carboxylesterase
LACTASGRNGATSTFWASAGDTHRVLAIDMPGSGESDWLADPNDYTFPTYLTTLVALIARSRAAAVDWIGTSMGGLLGIVVAAQPKSPVTRLVVNDVGPVIEPVALERIRSYFGLDPTFATYDEIEQYIRTVSAPFGRLTDAQWEHITRTNVRQRDDGRWRLAYDPGLRCRSGHPRRRRTCGASGMRSAARCSYCGAPSRISFRRPRPRRWRRADPDLRWSNSRTSVMRRCCCSSEQIDPVARFLRAEPAATAPSDRSAPPGAIGHHRLQSRSHMVLTLSLPPLDPRPANPPETRPGQVGKWLDEALTRNAIEAAQVIGDALAALNVVAMSDSRRMSSPRSSGARRKFSGRGSSSTLHRQRTPFAANRSRQAKASLGLAQELFVAYKRVLEHEGNKRVHFGGTRTLVMLIHRCIQCAWRILVNSYVAYAPIMPRRGSMRTASTRSRANADCTSVRYPPTSPRSRRNGSTSRRCCWRSPIPTAFSRASSTP